MLISALFSLSADLCLVDVQPENGELTLVLRSSQASAACPACVRPLYAPTCPARGKLCVRIWKCATLRAAPGVSPHHLCGTLPRAGARLCPADTATSRGPHRGRI